MTSPTLTIELENRTRSSNVHAYITGLALEKSNAVFLLRADGHTPYYPTSPSSPGARLAQDCAISLGSPGHITKATIPRIAGGRIWFSVDSKLTFLINPGPALVEPSVTNPSDPNIHLEWGFCEFTFNAAQLFANISYVDFVSIPIALTMVDTAGKREHVTGLSPNGLDKVCTGLVEQSARDGQGWKSLVVKAPNGRNLRALSPNNGIVTNHNLFSAYYRPYVEQVWAKFSNSPLQVDTQAAWGKVSGKVNSGTLNFGGAGNFAQPSTADIFSCSTGPFSADASVERGAVVARLAAGFNRSTLLRDSATHPEPSGNPSEYYKEKITNHYSRIVHEANADQRGYAFPYDDVAPSAGKDQSGAVFGNPRSFRVTVGGGQLGELKGEL